MTDFEEKIQGTGVRYLGTWSFQTRGRGADSGELKAAGIRCVGQHQDVFLERECEERREHGSSARLA